MIYSDNSQLSVAEEQNLNEEVIWSSKGLYGGDGWHRIRIPLKHFGESVKLILRAIVPANNFITVSNAKLVNELGDEEGCG